jgi:hypothetical protein
MYRIWVGGQFIDDSDVAILDDVQALAVAVLLEEPGVVEVGQNQVASVHAHEHRDGHLR